MQKTKLFEASTLQIHISDQLPLEDHGQEAYGFPVTIKSVMCAYSYLPSYQKDYYEEAIGFPTSLVA